MTKSVLSRILLKIRKDPSGCWLWTGGVNSNGYGQLSVLLPNGRRTMVKANRELYQLRKKVKLPSHIVVRHLCHNKRCLRLSYLKPGTKRANLYDSHYYTIVQIKKVRGWARREMAKIRREVKRRLGLKSRDSVNRILRNQTRWIDVEN